MKAMRIVTLVFAMVICGSTAYGQEFKELTLPPAPTREVSVLMQQYLQSGKDDNLTLAGLQYKKYVTEHRGIRMMAAYGNYRNFERPFAIKISPDTNSSRGVDTTMEYNSRTNIHLGIIGAGVEVQRRFYKKVILFAGLELRGGYGTGSYDTVTTRRYNDNQKGVYEAGTLGQRLNASMIYLGLMPSVGAKLQFKRLVVGAELTGVDISFRSIKVEGGNRSGVADVSLGNVTHRLFFGWRF